MQPRVKLERHAEGQFVLIPHKFEPAEENLVMRKDGDKLIIESASAPGNRCLNFSTL
jgi:hypothetical protein